MHLMSTVTVRDVPFVDASGATLYAQDGRAFIDFFADSGAASLGYNSTEHSQMLNRAATGTVSVPFHVPCIFNWPFREKLAARLCSKLEMDHVFFCTSGTEGIETAIKLARRWQWDIDKQNARTTIYTVAGAYHGRTYASMASGDCPSYHTDGYGPLPEGFQRFTEPRGIGEDCAAVLLSPVACSNDVRPYDQQWLRSVHRRAFALGAPVIWDEVQTGAGRSGTMSYADRFRGDFRPNISVFAKGLGMGFPVAAVVAEMPYSQAFTPGTHFSTFGGSGLGMLAIDGMMDWLDLHRGVPETVGQIIAKGIEGMPHVGAIRRVGAMVAFDCDVSIFDVANEAMKRGLIIGAFRRGVGVIKITPPLNISPDELEEGLKRLREALAAVGQ